MSSPTPTVLRCAIYTRKSSEEGLEQSFNSLHAQREACEAYIKSQAHEGWKLVPTIYDDGGYSGGSLDRPAIKQLLADVQAKRVQVVVVYKVDRLTRSLADFARIVETLDGHGASFVSVTQQFNTTSSMGRLTLNVLLSFAQFEREVTGERIRDKIAASKRKGLWMGGCPPLGYEPKDRTLVVVPDEAAVVRRIFARYLVLHSAFRVAKELTAQGIRTKQRTSKAGNLSGGALFNSGALNHLLRNPIYLGEIRHKGSVHPGQHEAILDRAIWDKTQECLRLGARRLRGDPALGSGSPLCGKIFDSAGSRMTPAHTQKADGRRYRSYASRAYLQDKATPGIEIPRISAGVIESIVMDALARHPDGPTIAEIDRVTVGASEVRINLTALIRDDGSSAQRSPIRIPVRLCARGSERSIQVMGQDGPTPEPDRALIRGLVRAHQWRQKLESGHPQSVEALARQEKLNATYVARLLPLAYLAPDITAGILDGMQCDAFKMADIRSTVVPLNWDIQRREFSMR